MDYEKLLYDIGVFLLRIRGMDLTVAEIASSIVEIVKRHEEDK